MKVCCISDIHENYDIKIPDCDLVLIGGDIFANPNIRSQLFWMNKFDVFVKSLESRGINWLMTAGNHDTIFEPQFSHLVPDNIKEHCLLDRYSHYIKTYNDLVILNKYKIYGSPWQRRYFDWSFNLDEEDLEKKWSLIPDDTDILLLHSPPFGILDGGLGSPSLTKRIEELSNIKLVVFGHIHYGYGAQFSENGIIYVNAAQCNERNKIVHEPICVEL